MDSVLSTPLETFARLSRRLLSSCLASDRWFTVKRLLSQRQQVTSAIWLELRSRIDTEALRIMPSATTRSADFEQLALPLFASLYNHAFWLTGNQAEAEDLVQETFSKALRAFDSFQTGTNFKAWLFRILHNTFLTSRTALAYSSTVFLEDHPGALDTATVHPTPEDILIRLNNQAALHTALEQLPPQLREVLLLSDVEDIKYKDIAIILDIPIGTVMSRISRARSTLRQLLQQQLGESL